GHVTRPRSDGEIIWRQTIDRDGTGVRSQKREQAGEQRRLARSVGTNQPESLAAPNLEGDAVQRLGLAAQATVALRDILHADHAGDDIQTVDGAKGEGRRAKGEKMRNESVRISAP